MMKYNEIESLTKELKYAKAEAERFRGEHQEACHLVAQMHAAAVGEVTGPNRGVVEDVEDLRLRAEKAEADNVKLRDAALSQGMTPPPPTPENLHAHSYGVGWWEGLAAMKQSMEISFRDGSNDSFVSSSKRARQRDYDALMREREQVGNALGERTQERDDALDDARRSHNLVVQFQKDGAKMRVLLDRAIEIVKGGE